MRNREISRTRSYPNPLHLFGAFAAVALFGLLPPAPAQAARLLEVRVGQHADYTRVVFELDSSSAFHVEPIQKGSQEILITMDAEGAARVVPSTSPLLKEVKVAPGPDGSVVQLTLRSEDIHVTQMVLKAPHRIVLDLRKRAPASKPVAAAPKAAATPKKTQAIQKTEVAKTDAKPAAKTPKATAKAVPTALKELPSSKAEEKPAVAPVAKADGKDSKAAEAAPAPKPTAPAVAASSSLPEATPASPARPGAGIVGRKDPIRGPNAVPPRNATPSKATTAKKVPTRSAQKAPAVAKKNPEPEPSLAESLSSPYILGGIGALIVILLVMWRRMRRQDAEGASSSVEFPPEDDDAAAIGDNFNVADRIDSSSLAGAAPAFEPPDAVSDYETDAPDPEKEEETMKVHETAIGSDAPVVASAAVAEEIPGIAIGDVVHQVEQKVEQLEGRVQELLDARERLERQINAQTEELRVQRAAIARTQRVVRTLARPDLDSTDTTPEQ